VPREAPLARLSRIAGRLGRAAARRGDRLVRGPDRLGIPRELLREGRFLVARRLAPTVEVRWPSGRYVVSTADMDVSRRTFVSGPYGLERLLAAAELIERETGRGVTGREVLEIGANIGTTTVPLVTVLGAAHVHAFEPAPRNLELLERNIAGNDLSSRVTVHAAALSDHVGSLELTVPERYWGSSRVVATGGPQTHTTRCVTIDSLLTDATINQATLALVWIDVEGHEAAVLAGATQLRPTPLVLEYDPAQHSDITKLHGLIDSLDCELYDLATGQRTSLSQLELAAAERPTDVLALPRACRAAQKVP
jgi:FkbM family methyltransferase